MAGNILIQGGVYYDERDRFCLDGQRLMAIAGSDGAEYRTEDTSTNLGAKT